MSRTPTKRPTAPALPTPPSVEGLYDDPHVYDILHAQGTADEFRLVAELADRYGRPVKPGSRRVWLEPACGTARHLRAAFRAQQRDPGHGSGADGRDRVIGIDTNPGMLAYARDRLERLGVADRAQLIEADITAFSDQARWKATCAFCLVNSLRHLSKDKSILTHLDDTANALRAGGVYVVGMHMARYQYDAVTRDVFTAARGRVRVRQYVTSTPSRAPSDRIERIDSVCRVGTPGRAELRHDRYPLRAFSVSQWARLLARSAVRPVAVTDANGNEVDVRVPWPSGDDGYRLWVLGRAQDTDAHPGLTPEATRHAI